MADLPDRIERLEHLVETLTRRLEAGANPTMPPLGEETEGTAGSGEAVGEVRGTLTYSGSIELGGRRLVVERREDVSRAVTADAESLSKVFAAFASPYRIAILRSLLEGPRTSQELQAVVGAGAVGQLYHHLRELQSAHLVVQQRRSVYAIPKRRVMLICILLATTPRLVTNGQPPPSLAEAEEEPDERTHDGHTLKEG